MKKIERIEEIKRMSKILQEHLKVIKINFEIFDDELLMLASSKRITEGYKWLLDVFEKEYKKYKYVLNLLPEREWKTYETWGGALMLSPEIRLRAKSRKELRKRLVSADRPILFKLKQLKKELGYDEAK